MGWRAWSCVLLPSPDVPLRYAYPEQCHSLSLFTEVRAAAGVMMMMMMFGVSVALLSEECKILYKHWLNKCYLSIITIRWPYWNNQPAVNWSFSLLQSYLAWWNNWHTYCVLWFPYFPCSFYFVPCSFRSCFGGRNLIFKECLFSNCETGKKIIS